MKTDRLTLLVAPADKAAIAARAAALDMSVSELVRRAALDYDPAEAAHLDELRALLPELKALADRIEARRADWEAEEQARAARWAVLDSPATRARIKAELLADDSLDWPALRRLFVAAEPAA
jgi:hypothetical protein